MHALLYAACLVGVADLPTPEKFSDDGFVKIFGGKSQDVPGNGGIIITEKRSGDFGPNSGLFLRSSSATATSASSR